MPRVVETRVTHNLLICDARKAVSVIVIVAEDSTRHNIKLRCELLSQEIWQSQTLNGLSLRS
jgi:hypothetical protein